MISGNRADCSCFSTRATSAVLNPFGYVGVGRSTSPGDICSRAPRVSEGSEPDATFSNSGTKRTTPFATFVETPYNVITQRRRNPHTIKINTLVSGELYDKSYGSCFGHGPDA